MDDLRGQVPRSAAEIYEQFFVPAMFAEWAPRVAEAARLMPGDRVLDVACGTGVLAREAAARVAPGGRVTGLDLNDGMLAVARAKAPEIDWRQGAAEAIGEPDDAFDAVVSQFGLMFFADRVAALKEMRRVLRAGGRLALAVWGRLVDAPGYAAMAALLDRLFGAAIAEELRAPYRLGDREALVALLGAAGMPDAEIRSVPGTVRFPSIEAWVHTDIKGWTLADRIDDGQYAALRRAAPEALASFLRADGSVAFAHPALIVSATKA